MAVKVRVQNFQSIEDATVEISGFTVITGQNNGGKSALMRAIRGAFQNTRGSSFVRHGTAKTMVSIDLGNGHTIYWEKGKDAKPTYIIDKGKPMHPGQAVPDEVAALGVHAISAGGREIWPQFAPQFTGQIFLLDQPGSVLAEAVADVDRVSQLNQALRLSESDRRATNSELKVRKTDKERAEAALERFEGMDDVIAVVDAIENDAKRLIRVDKALVGLQEIKDRMDTATGTVSRLAGVELLDIPHASELDYLRDILNGVAQLESFQDSMTKATSQVKALAGVETIQTDVDMTTINRLAAAIDVSEGLSSRYNTARDQVASLEKEVDDAEKEALDSEKAVADFLIELGSCPVCGATTGPGGPAHETHP